MCAYPGTDYARRGVHRVSVNEKEMQAMSWSAPPKTAFGRRVGSVIGFNDKADERKKDFLYIGRDAKNKILSASKRTLKRKYCETNISLLVVISIDCYRGYGA